MGPPQIEAKNDPKAAEYKQINDWVGQYMKHQRAEEYGQDCDVEAPEDCPGCSLTEDEDVMKYLLTAAGLRMRFDLKELTDQQIESAIENALANAEAGEGGEETAWGSAPEVPAGQMSDDVREKLGTRAAFILANGPKPAFMVDLEAYQMPRGFAKSECLKACTWGAAHAQTEYGGRTHLVCTNAKCYQAKVEKGKETFAKQVAKQIKKDAAAETEAINGLRTADQAEQLRSYALALMMAEKYHQVKAYGDYHEHDLKRERESTANVRRLLGLEIQQGTIVYFQANHNEPIDLGLKAKVEALSTEDLQELLVNLAAYSTGRRS